MSGWCPFSSVCGMAVVCGAVVLSSAVVWVVPCSSHCSAGEYCCHVVHCCLPDAAVRVRVCVCAVRVVGYPLCAPPPHSGGGWGHHGRAGGLADGGWHDEGRVAVLLTPRRMLVSPVCVLASPLSFTLWPY